jgi:DNA helicase II / ATP-dependent DNA helicase PcrA
MQTCEDALIIHGAPGTGKTYECSQILKKHLQNGISEKDILYTTYRREATADALLKISTDTGIKIGKLRGVVNTTHGICLSLLYSNGMINNTQGENNVFDERTDILKFNAEYGYSIKPNGATQDTISTGTADQFLQTYSLMRATMTPLNEVYKLGVPIQYTINEFKTAVRDLEKWKSANNKIEFADMIDIVIKEGLIPDSKIQIFDEAQDMTPQLYKVSKMWAEEAESVVVAGDPLQTLYTYNGASPKHFIDWGGKLEILPESRRLTGETWRIASRIIETNTPYKVPEIKTRTEKGKIMQINSANLEHLLSSNPPTSETFHLVRTNYMGGQIAEILTRAGIPFSGLKQYGWTPTERNLYNAIRAIQTFRQLKKSEYCAILDRYPARLTGAPGSLIEITGLKKRIENGEYIPSMKNFDPILIESIKTDTPLKLSNVKNKLSIMKIEGAIRRGLPAITKGDIDRVKVLTIHGAKGMQANTVFIHTGITSAVNRAMTTQIGKENEAYVWYVGVTRTINNLVFVTYNGNQYPIEGVCV